MVLAHHAGMLFSTNAVELLSGLRGACATAPTEFPLASESEEDRGVVRGRLGKLKSSPELRGRYVELVSDVWNALATDWEREGRRCVNAAVAERRELLAKEPPGTRSAAPSTRDSDLLTELAGALEPWVSGWNSFTPRPRARGAHQARFRWARIRAADPQ